MALDGFTIWFLAFFVPQFVVYEREGLLVAEVNRPLPTSVCAGVATCLDSDAAWVRQGFLGLGIEIVKPVRPSERFAFAWEVF